MARLEIWLDGSTVLTAGTGASEEDAAHRLWDHLEAQTELLGHDPVIGPRPWMIEPGDYASTLTPLEAALWRQLYGGDPREVIRRVAASAERDRRDLERWMYGIYLRR